MKKLVCWDWNETVVGNDRKSANKIIRPNLAEVLGLLRGEGYSNVVTTTIAAQEVEKGLKGHGIDSLVDGVYGGVRNFSGGKTYKEAVNAAQIEFADALHHVVVIGDKDHDHSTDSELKEVVFLYNPEGISTDAMVVHELLKQLRERGNDSFYQGFQSMHTTHFSLKDEFGFDYHGMLQLNGEHKAVALSTYNDCSWSTPTILLASDKEAAMFERFER